MDLQVDLHSDGEIDLTIYSGMTRHGLSAAVVGKLSLMDFAARALGGVAARTLVNS